MMYAQKEAKAARQFKAAAIFATLVFHLALFAAIGSGIFGASEKPASDNSKVKQELAADEGHRTSIKP